MAIRVALTGRVSIETDGASIDEQRFPGRQGRLVFAYLLAEQDRPVPRDELAEALWNGELPATWEKALTVLVSKLRVMLEECGIDGTAITSAFGCYKLTLPEGAWVDLTAAEHGIERAETALAAGEPDEARTTATTAIELARRTFLPGEDTPWVEEKRRHLRRLLLRGLECHADAGLSSGRVAESVRSAEQIVELEPFRESGYRRLMQAHIAAGNSAEALNAYERCRHLLAEELGAYPSAEIESLYLEILRAPPRTRSTHTPKPALTPPDIARDEGHALSPPQEVQSDVEVAAGTAIVRRRSLWRHRRLLAILAGGLIASAAVLIYALGGDSEPNTRAFAGSWSSIDQDGSNQTLAVIRRANTDSYDLTLEDDDAQTCGGGSVDGTGVGNVAGNRLSFKIRLTCASGPKLEFFYPLTYYAADDTLVDRTGVVWSRMGEAGMDDASTPAGGGEESRAASLARVALVVDRPLGVGQGDPFLEPFLDGLRLAERQYDVETEVVVGGWDPAATANVSAGERLRSGHFDLVVVVGVSLTALETIAHSGEPTRFVLLDSSVHWIQDGDVRRNVTGFLFDDRQAGYLVGYLSGLVESRPGGRLNAPHIVSVVGGVRGVTPVEQLVAGFADGARQALPGITVLEDYSGDFIDQSKCEAVANEHIDRGADIVFAAAGTCSLGALSAAEIRGVWGIGVDGDRSYLGDHILASAEKRFDEAVLLAVRSFVQGTLPAGRDVVLGLDDAAVGITGISPEVPDAIRRDVAHHHADRGRRPPGSRGSSAGPRALGARPPGAMSRWPALRTSAQRSEAATCSRRSIASCMPASMPELMCASRPSFVGCSTRTVRVVFSAACSSASGMPS